MVSLDGEMLRCNWSTNHSRCMWGVSVCWGSGTGVCGGVLVNQTIVTILASCFMWS